MDTFCSQEIYFQYNGKSAASETFGMKLYPLVLIAMQGGEIICYYLLYKYIHQHQVKRKSNAIFLFKW